MRANDLAEQMKNQLSQLNREVADYLTAESEMITQCVKTLNLLAEQAAKRDTTIDLGFRLANGLNPVGAELIAKVSAVRWARTMEFNRD